MKDLDITSSIEKIRRIQEKNAYSAPSSIKQIESALAEMSTVCEYAAVQTKETLRALKRTACLLELKHFPRHRQGK